MVRMGLATLAVASVVAMLWQSIAAIKLLQFEALRMIAISREGGGRLALSDVALTLLAMPIITSTIMLVALSLEAKGLRELCVARGYGCYSWKVHALLSLWMAIAIAFMVRSIVASHGVTLYVAPLRHVDTHALAKIVRNVLAMSMIIVICWGVGMLSALVSTISVIATQLTVLIAQSAEGLRSSRIASVIGMVFALPIPFVSYVALIHRSLSYIAICIALLLLSLSTAIKELRATRIELGLRFVHTLRTLGDR